MALSTIHMGECEDRLVWNAQGSLQSIGNDSIVVDNFQYELTSSTAYERNNQPASRESFVVGDHVKVKFITDRSVLELVGKSSDDDQPDTTPAPIMATPIPTPEATPISTRLSPFSIVPTRARGEVRSTYTGRKNRFVINVRIPRNTVPLATTNAEAKALSLTATITRRGEDLATCGLRFESRRRELSRYDFKTDIESTTRRRVTKVRARKGSCTLANGATGVPRVKDGDNVSISEADGGDFLQGTF
jgi:hypothetical protein